MRRQTTWRIHQIREGIRLFAWLLLIAPPAVVCRGGSSFPAPSEDELERTVGYAFQGRIAEVNWRADEPRQTNLPVYAGTTRGYDETLMRRVADAFGVLGAIEVFRDAPTGAFGYWLRELNPTNRFSQREIAFIVTTGAFRYGTADDGRRYDSKKKAHLEYRVPSKEEAREKALTLLPLLNLSTNDLEHDRHGRLRCAYGESGITYNDRVSGQRKREVIQRSVSFFQRVPSGGTTSSVGDGGQVRFTFVSEGKLTGIEWFFRKLEVAAQAKPRSRQDIIKDIKAGRFWTWQQKVPRALTVTNCELAYPQGNSGTYQPYVWPFYMVSATGKEGGTVTLFLPAKWRD